MTTSTQAHSTDPVQQFVDERAAAVRAMSDDDTLRRQSLEWIEASCPHKYSYNFSWMGRPIIQYPQDVLAMQEIIWRTQPDLIIETGIAHGGSLVFYASMLELLGGDRRVVGIDIEIRPHNREAIESHPMADRVDMIEGSSIHPGTIEQVYAICDQYQRVMVVLDSHHSHEHVLAELHAYAPLVTTGCYLVVLDTIIEDLPAGMLADGRWDVGNSPKTAVHAFLRETNRFVIDQHLNDKLLISVSPDGYLLCTG